MIQINGGITSPKGFKATGIHAGIKKEKKDMALIYSLVPCKATGTFTKNIVKAAPVKWDMDILKKSTYSQAVVINSGVANACTGLAGLEHCNSMAEETGSNLGIPAESVLVASTGVIGKQLPIDTIKSGIQNLVPLLGDTIEDGTLAAEAIMTTDTKKKEIAVSLEIDGKEVIIGGMCKGSGMIHPDMCTMLSFVTSDISISKELLQEALATDVQDTYNMISVDGDTSTNDTVLLLANGLAGNNEIKEKDENYYKFLEALNFVNTYLSKKIAEDGEGATALFEVKVINAETKEQAKVLSKSIITSNLTKAAIFGHDPNWGRVLCAMGYSGAMFDPDKVDLYFESSKGTIKLVEDGMELEFDKKKASDILSSPEVTAITDIKMGDASATAWGCDLSYEYVRINADYTS